MCHGTAGNADVLLVGSEMLGDPAATWPAIASLVDSDNPPLRLILGDNLAMVRLVYGERMKTWEAWDYVSKAAQGTHRA